MFRQGGVRSSSKFHKGQKHGASKYAPFVTRLMLFLN